MPLLVLPFFVGIANFLQSQAGELLMGVYINTKEGDAVTLKVTYSSQKQVLNSLPQRY